MKKIYFIFLLFPILSHAQKNYPELLDKHMQAELKVKEYNGTVLVVQKGKTIYQKAFGLADREWNIPNSLNTKFRIGSITKQFTAACILQLSEKGLLYLDDKLSKYIPDYPKGDSVTIHMLLNHTSGIKNYTNMEAFWPKAILPLPIDSMIAIFKYAPYDFSPGTKFNYSNSGYYLLGFIIEKVSGTTYREYLLKNVIQKAGLKNTDVDRLDSILQYRAKGYAKTNTGWRHAQLISMEAPYSAGAMVSTVNDLHSWMKALLSHTIISAKSLIRMTTPYKNNYGYGLDIDSLKTHRRIWHNGGIPGFSSVLVYYPNEDLYIVAISNNESNSTGIANSLASILFDLPVMTPYIPKEVKIDGALLDGYVGKYVAAGPIELVKLDGKLFRRIENGEDVELKPESTTRFFYADESDRFIEFEKDKAGTIIKAWFISRGDKTEMKKL
jgi:CubicO group peptidase (beta-lactamase class C family)